MMWVLLSALMLINGCRQDSNGPVEPRKLAGVTDLKAHTENSTTIVLSWQPSTDEGLNEMEGYRVLTKLQNGAVIRTTDIDKGAVGLILQGLLEGIVYVFDVISMPTIGADLFLPSDVASIRWSPARRFTTDNNNLPIRVYETTSTMNSGLIVFDSASGKPKVVSVANPGPDSLAIDLFAQSDTNNSVTLRSASIYNSGWRLTRFSFFANLSPSLNDPRAMPLDTVTYNQQSTRIDSGISTSSLIIYFRTQDSHYGRILVQRDPTTGRLVRGTSPDQYLELSISYQSAVRNPYARARHLLPP